MASGEEIPYQLRPNKFIDRQIFMELLSKVVPHKRHGNYAYISMGGKHLVDLEAVYRKIGIENLYSFDGNFDVVERQKCNLPHFSTICEKMHSSALAGSIDEIVQKFDLADHMIVWLDYTDASRLAQLQEFAEVLKRCQAGDLVRITLNAYYKTLSADDWQTKQCVTPSHRRAERLRDQIGEFLPATVETVTEHNLPNALAGAVSMAVADAQASTNLKFVPILLTSYADGQRMFTATVLAIDHDAGIPNGLDGWEFLAKGWTNILEISVPDLSIREKVIIDRHLSKGPSRIIKAAKFKPTSEQDEATFALKSYKRLHRFYPTFQAIGVH